MERTDSRQQYSDQLGHSYGWQSQLVYSVVVTEQMLRVFGSGRTMNTMTVIEKKLMTKRTALTSNNRLDKHAMYLVITCVYYKRAFSLVYMMRQLCFSTAVLSHALWLPINK